MQLLISVLFIFGTLVLSINELNAAGTTLKVFINEEFDSSFSIKFERVPSFNKDAKTEYPELFAALKKLRLDSKRTQRGRCNNPDFRVLGDDITQLSPYISLARCFRNTKELKNYKESFSSLARKLSLYKEGQRLAKIEAEKNQKFESNVP